MDAATLIVLVLLIFAGVGIPWALFLDRQDAAAQAQETTQSESEGND